MTYGTDTHCAHLADDAYGVTPYAGAGAGSMEIVHQQTARATAMGLARPRTVLVEQQPTGYACLWTHQLVVARVRSSSSAHGCHTSTLVINLCVPTGVTLGLAMH